MRELSPRSYIRNRAILRKLSREAMRESWEVCVKRLEYETTRSQRFRFKVFKYLKVKITDNARTDLISEESETILHVQTDVSK
jgi:hypothetical protein